MEERTQIVSLLFADIAGSCKVANDPLYVKLKHLNDDFEKRCLRPANHFMRNTWGDAFFICSYDPLDAAEIALDLRDYYRNQSWKRLGFPEPLSIRIGLHAARVTILVEADGVSDIVGVNVNAAARIEPVVEANQVYCSDVFWNHLSREPNLDFQSESLGEVELAKQFGKMHLYRLMRSYETSKVERAPGLASHGGQVGAKAPQQDYALLFVEDRMQIIPVEHVEYSENVRLTLLPQSPVVASFLAGLREVRREHVGVAWGNTALLGRVEAVSQARGDAQEKWSVTLVPEDTDYGAGTMEMSTTNHPADKLAEMRARRILLDERWEIGGRADQDFANNAMMEVLIRGQNSPIKVEESPLPKLYRELREDPDLFVAAARLVAILWLRLSGVVEHVLRLDLHLSEDGTLGVDFAGRRARKYGNVEPPTIEVSGVCNLSG